MTVTVRTVRVTWLAARLKLPYRGDGRENAGRIEICRPACSESHIACLGESRVASSDSVHAKISLYT
jgi:hypothetical protein